MCHIPKQHTSKIYNTGTSLNTQQHAIRLCLIHSCVILVINALYSVLLICTVITYRIQTWITDIIRSHMVSRSSCFIDHSRDQLNGLHNAGAHTMQVTLWMSHDAGYTVYLPRQ